MLELFYKLFGTIMNLSNSIASQLFKPHHDYCSFKTYYLIDCLINICDSSYLNFLVLTLPFIDHMPPAK